MKKFALHPQELKTGEYISFDNLVELYNLDKENCIGWYDNDFETYVGLNANDYIHLYPREEIDYLTYLDELLGRDAVKVKEKIDPYLLVDILGDEWRIEFGNKDTHEALGNLCGLCDFSSKKIVVDDFSAIEKEATTIENIKEFINKVIRHEIIHAYLIESGLGDCCSWAVNEEMVDWIAKQFPKMLKTFKQADCI